LILTGIITELANFAAGSDAALASFSYPPTIITPLSSALDEVSLAVSVLQTLRQALAQFQALTSLSNQQLLRSSIAAIAISLVANIINFSNLNTPSLIPYGAPPTVVPPPLSNNVFEWLVATVIGTTLVQYKSLIQSLPDGGTGTQIVFNNVDFQGYVTSQATRTSKTSPS
jgi:hypothetical protein